MENKKKKKRKDVNELAFDIVQKATNENNKTINNEFDGKNPAAVALGRLGGLKGGLARAKKLTKEQRKKIARKAAKARWSKDK